MDFKDYINRMLLIIKISKLPIDDINAEIGFLRLQNIDYYEPCLQYIKEKFLRKEAVNLSYKRNFLSNKKP